MFSSKNICDEISMQLWDYTAGKLSAEECQQVEEHLHLCVACQQQAKEYRQTVSMMKGYKAEEVPASQKSWGDLTARLEGNALPAGFRPQKVFFAAWAIAVPALAAVLFLFCTIRARKVETSANPSVSRPVVTANPTPVVNPRVEAEKPLMQYRRQDLFAQNESVYQNLPLPLLHKEGNRLLALRRRGSVRQSKDESLFSARESRRPVLAVRRRFRLAHRSNAGKQVSQPVLVQNVPPSSESAGVHYTVDGEMSATIPLQKEYVISTILVSDEGAGDRQFVMGTIPDVSSTTRLPKAQSHKELIAW